MDLSILHLNGLKVEIYFNIFLFLFLANSADPAEMPPYMYVLFHLGLHCLPKNLFTSIQNEKT